MSTENTPKSDLESLTDKIRSFDVEEDNTEIISEEQTNDPTTEVVAETEAEVLPVAEEKAIINEYSPDLTYRVHDELLSFDEKVKEYIKSKEDEEFFRDLYTKAGGIDVIKPKLEKYREEAHSYKSSVEELTEKVRNSDKSWDYYNNLLASGSKGDSESINTLLDLMKIDDQILGRVLADRLEMTPAQKSLVSSRSEAAHRNYELEQKNASMEQRMAEFERQQAEAAISSTINSEKYLDIINFVDEKLGKDTFLNEVKTLGIDLEVNQGKEVTVEQVADLIANKYRGFMPQANNPVSAHPVGQPEVRKKQVIKSTETIPNVGSGSAPVSVGTEIKSVDDLRKAYKDHINGKDI